MIDQKQPLRTIAHIRARSKTSRDASMSSSSFALILHFGHRAGQPYWGQTGRFVARNVEHATKFGSWKAIRTFDMGDLDLEQVKGVETWAMRVSETLQKGVRGANQIPSNVSMPPEEAESLAKGVEGLEEFVHNLITPGTDLPILGPLAPLAEEASSL